VICSYVAGPSTWNDMFSVARKPSAASGTSISPVAQLLKGNRPARRLNARLLMSKLVKRIRIMKSVYHSRRLTATFALGVTLITAPLATARPETDSEAGGFTRNAGVLPPERVRGDLAVIGRAASARVTGPSIGPREKTSTPWRVRGLNGALREVAVLGSDSDAMHSR
jgi:hypothetical protein